VTAARTDAFDEIEDLDAFRERARAFIRANLRKVGPMVLALRDKGDDDELAAVAREREIQRMLSDNDLAGICWPREYGGQGLTPAHQRVLNEELAGYEYPAHLQVPTLAPCAAVLLELGTEEQRRAHLPAILRGEELWVQFLSEPSGGSDVAGALTTAVRDGDEWVLNGSKVWTTGAWWSDWGLCLARTNWDVPKHRGLTVFILPVRAEGVELHRIEMLNGNREFCQEFFTDVRIPDSYRVGDVDGGWAVATRWMFHERMLFNSPLVTFAEGTLRRTEGAATAFDIARDAGRLYDPQARDLIGESHMLALVTRELEQRVTEGIATGAMLEQAAAIGRLFSGVSQVRSMTIALELAGAAGAVWADDDGRLGDSGIGFLMRQSACIGGGTTEMARNVISERVLGMPREQTFDRNLAFRDQPRNG
jgi:alkylation response protein AidB-like acyl-CoA dehydrogenase